MEGKPFSLFRVKITNKSKVRHIDVTSERRLSVRSCFDTGNLDFSLLVKNLIASSQGLIILLMLSAVRVAVPGACPDGVPVAPRRLARVVGPSPPYPLAVVR